MNLLRLTIAAIVIAVMASCHKEEMSIPVSELGGPNKCSFKTGEINDKYFRYYDYWEFGDKLWGIHDLVFVKITCDSIQVDSSVLEFCMGPRTPVKNIPGLDEIPFYIKSKDRNLFIAGTPDNVLDLVDSSFIRSTIYVDRLKGDSLLCSLPNWYSQQQIEFAPIEIRAKHPKYGGMVEVPDTFYIGLKMTSMKDLYEEPKYGWIKCVSFSWTKHLTIIDYAIE